eukprot:3844500-Pleurochrysis_carterae.AAC.3
MLAHGWHRWSTSYHYYSPYQRYSHPRNPQSLDYAGQENAPVTKRALKRAPQKRQSARRKSAKVPAAKAQARPLQSARAPAATALEHPVRRVLAHPRRHQPTASPKTLRA